MAEWLGNTIVGVMLVLLVLIIWSKVFNQSVNDTIIEIKDIFKTIFGADDE